MIRAAWSTQAPQNGTRNLVSDNVTPTALDDESLTRRALLLAAAYRLHCMHRRGPAPLGTPVEVPRALEQAVKMAARGHQWARASLDLRWIAATSRGVRRLASWQPVAPARPALR